MDIEMIILYAAIAVGVGFGAYKAYKKLMVDGKITLDELIELGEDIAGIVKELPSLSSLKKMKKDELISLCKENGLEVDGTKAELLANLEKVKNVVE
tara:strand:+ start:224 stop:514 length:291 start_codon:yes stop_codon:yes gene_type:complete